MKKRVSLLVVLFLAAAMGTSVAAQTKRLAAVPSEDLSSFDRGDKVAVVVGVGNYPKLNGLAKLQFAARDAEAVARRLERYGYSVNLLRDEQANWGTVNNALKLASSVVDDDGTLLFYFSGHGFSDESGESYLATVETTPQNLQRTGTALKEVMELVQGSRAQRKMLLIDACRDEATVGTKSMGLRSMGELKQSEGVRVLYSTKSGSYSYEDTELGHGLFTYYLLKGLDGEAARSDNLVTFRDLADYTTRKVKLHAFQRSWSQIPFEGSGEASGDFLIGRVLPGSVKPSAPSPVHPTVQEVPAAGASALRSAQSFASDPWGGLAYFLGNGDVATARSFIEKAVAGARLPGKVKRELSVLGKPAPTFSVQKWLHGSAQLNLENRKPTVLVFWEEWCPHSRREIPKLESIHARYRDRGLTVVGLTKLMKSSTEDKARSFLAANGVKYPVGRDDGSFSNYFDVSGVPAVAVVQAGKVIWRGHPAKLTNAMIDEWLRHPGHRPGLTQGAVSGLIRDLEVRSNMLHPLSPQDTLETEARAEFVWIDKATRRGDYAEAKRLMDAFERKYSATKAMRSVRRMAKELSVIGKQASASWLANQVDQWYQGGNRSLSDRGTKLLVFWETWCPHCQREVPKLSAFYDKYRRRGLEVIGFTKLTKSSTPDKVRQFINDRGVNYPIAKENATISDHFAVSGIPAAALVKDGVIVWRGHPGKLSEAQIERHLP